MEIEFEGESSLFSRVTAIEFRIGNVIRMAVLAGLVVLGIPTLIAAVVGGTVDSDAIPYVLATTTTLAIVTLFVIRARLRRRRPFQAREVFTEDQWYNRFYGQTEFPRTVILSVLSAFATELGGTVRPTQLRPDDRLEDFALGFWGVLTDDSFEKAECELAIALGDDFEPDPSWRTLDDVIVGTCQKVRVPSNRPT